MISPLCKPSVNHEYEGAVGAKVSVHAQGEEEACSGRAGGWCTSVCLRASIKVTQEGAVACVRVLGQGQALLESVAAALSCPRPGQWLWSAKSTVLLTAPQPEGLHMQLPQSLSQGNCGLQLLRKPGPPRRAWLMVVALGSTACCGPCPTCAALSTTQWSITQPHRWSCADTSSVSPWAIL